MEHLLIRMGLLLLLISTAPYSNAETQEPSSPTFTHELTQDYKTAYYWAFYGSYHRDPQALGEMISRLSDLTSKIYEISSVNAYQNFKLDIRAQGGPQLTLALAGVRRVLEGLQLGMNQEVSAVINAAHRVNPQFAASLSILALEFSGKRVDRHIKDYALPPRISDLDQCLRSCPIHFLGLQKNMYVRGIINGQFRDSRLHRTLDVEEALSRFPGQQQKRNPRFRKGINPEVASMSNECITTCLEQISTAAGGALIFAGFTAVKAGVPAHISLGVGMAAGAIGGSTMALKCFHSSDCAKDQAQVQKERDAQKLKTENDQREQSLRKNDLDRREREQNDQKERDRKIAEQKEQEAKREEEARRVEEKRKEEQKAEQDARKREQEIRDSFDRNKNQQATSDSSASCETTKTCSETMTAVQINEKYQEPKQSVVMTDGHGNIIQPSDLVTTPTHPNTEEYDEISIPSTDGNGDVLTKMDLISTPSKIRKENTPNIIYDGHGNVVKKIDLVSTPQLCIDGCFVKTNGVSQERDIHIFAHGKR